MAFESRLGCANLPCYFQQPGGSPRSALHFDSLQRELGLRIHEGKEIGPQACPLDHLQFPSGGLAGLGGTRGLHGTGLQDPLRGVSLCRLHRRVIFPAPISHDGDQGRLANEVEQESGVVLSCFRSIRLIILCRFVFFFLEFFFLCELLPFALCLVDVLAFLFPSDPHPLAETQEGTSRPSSPSVHAQRLPPIHRHDLLDIPSMLCLLRATRK